MPEWRLYQKKRDPRFAIEVTEETIKDPFIQKLLESVTERESKKWGLPLRYGVGAWIVRGNTRETKDYLGIYLNSKEFFAHYELVDEPPAAPGAPGELCLACKKPFDKGEFVHVCLVCGGSAHLGCELDGHYQDCPEEEDSID